LKKTKTGMARYLNPVLSEEYLDWILKGVLVRKYKITELFCFKKQRTLWIVNRISR
jgi:hypothetical protein